MAWINDDKSQNNKQSGLGGGGSYFSGGISAGAAPTKQMPKSQAPGSGFANIDNWLNNSQGGAGMAGDIAGKSDTYGNTATGMISGYEKDAGSQIQSGIPVFDQGTADQWMTNTGVNSNTMSDISNGKPFSPVTFTPTGRPDTSYKGPTESTSLGSYSPAQATTAKTQQWNDLGKSESGVQTQLRTLYGHNPYTNGENRLDSAFTKSGQGAGIMANSQDKWGGISGMLSGSADKVQGQISSATDQAAAVGKQWDNAETAAKINAGLTNTAYAKADRDATDKRNAEAAAQSEAAKKAESAEAARKAEAEKARLAEEARLRKEWQDKFANMSTPPGGSKGSNTPGINYYLDPRNWANPADPTLGALEPATEIPILQNQKALKTVNDATGKNFTEYDEADPVYANGYFYKGAKWATDRLGR